MARTDVGVLLLGESGTGTGMVARTIHENSARSRKPFIIVNCAALPPDLLESELFGHERGAFTSAVSQKIGKFEAADGGTVFLDEIGELPLALQPKLLRVLQEHTFERVGDTSSLHADVRIIAATNRLLEEDVEEKTFRADLFYRLNAYVIRLPPLRDRRSHVLPLAQHFLERYASRNQTFIAGLTEEAVLALQQYSLVFLHLKAWYPLRTCLPHIKYQIRLFVSFGCCSRQRAEAAGNTKLLRTNYSL